MAHSLRMRINQCVNFAITASAMRVQCKPTWAYSTIPSVQSTLHVWVEETCNQTISMKNNGILLFYNQKVQLLCESVENQTEIPIKVLISLMVLIYPQLTYTCMHTTDKRAYAIKFKIGNAMSLCHGTHIGVRHFKPYCSVLARNVSVYLKIHV